MNSFAEISLRRFFENRVDVFGDDSEFLFFEIDPTYTGHDGFNSTTVFGRIVYRLGNEKRTSESLVVKQMPQTFKFASDSEILQMVNEVFFYTHVLPVFDAYRNVDSLFAEFHDSNLRIGRGRKEAAIIFENLQASAFRLAERKSFLDYDHLSLMLRKLGNFHAYSLKAKKEDPIRFRAMCDLFVNTYAVNFRKHSKYFAKLAKYGLRVLRQQPQYSRELAKVERILDSAMEYVEQLFIGDRNNTMSVLCHGDYLRGNVMFKYDENGKPVDMKMIDMANCVLACPVVDLAQVLYLNTDQRMRDEHWQDLVDEYYAGLGEYFSDTELPSRNDIVKQFEEKSLIAYIIASYFLGHTIVADNNSESIYDCLPSKYKTVGYENIPLEERFLIARNVGGSLTAKALTDILKDMIDRKFI